MLGRRGAELEFIEVLQALTDLSSEGQPHVLVLGQRDELDAVPEVIRLTPVHASQYRPVLVETPNLILGPLELARSLTGLVPGRQHAVDAGQQLERQPYDDGCAPASNRSHGGPAGSTPLRRTILPAPTWSPHTRAHTGL